MNYLVIALLWAAYCLQHSYLISVGFSNVMKKRLKDYYAFYRLFYVIISIVLLIPVLYVGEKLRSDVIINWHQPWNYIRYAVMAGALLIFLKSFFFDYDSLSFLGIRQIMNFNWKKERPHITGISRKGLLGIVRHPMYFSAVVLIWCNTFRFTDIVVNSVLTAYFIIGTILEEKKLVMEFGKEYTSYQKEVPMLIPFFKFKKKIT